MESARPARKGTAPGPRRRRRLFPIVDPYFQWKYSIIIAVVGAGCTAIMGVFLYGAHRANTALIEFAGDTRLQEQVVRGDELFALYLLITVFVLALTLGAWGLVVTHRISGPVAVAGRYLSVMAAGQYPDVRPLRKRDELKDFFKILVEVVQQMRQRDYQALKEIDKALALAQRGLEGTDASATQAALREVSVALEERRHVLAAAIGVGEGVAVDAESEH